MAVNHFRLTERKGKKVILVSTNLCTPNELALVREYIAQGYEPIERKEKKTSGKGIKKDDIVKYADEKNNKELKKLHDEKSNYMVLLNKYKKILRTEIEKFVKDTDNKELKKLLDDKANFTKIKNKYEEIISNSIEAKKEDNKK